MENILKLKKENDKMFNEMRDRNAEMQKILYKTLPDNKYFNGKIYVLSVDGFKDGNYIGSTIRTIKHRLNKHKESCKRYLNGKYHYITSFKLIKYAMDNNLEVKIKLLEVCPCKTKLELEQREGWWMNNYDGKLINHHRAGMNIKDNLEEYHKNYNLKNKEKINLQKKIYYLEHINEIKAWQKQKFECECVIQKFINYGI